MAADTGEYGRGPDDRLRAEIIGVTPFGRPAPHLAVAVARAGGTGVLDLGADPVSGAAALADLRRWWTGPFGIRVPAGCRVRPAEIPAAVDTVLVDAPALRSDDSLDVAGFARGRRLLVEVVGPDEAAAVVPVARGFTGDVGIIARGREAGGRTGDLSTFVLLQRLLADPSVDVPVFAAGGIGPHTAAAAVAGGAAGVVLDVQLALVREADPPAELAAALANAGDADAVTVQGRPLPVGRDGRAAAALAARYRTAGGVVQAVRERIGGHLRAAVRSAPLAPRGDGSAPAYPVVQAPMTHVTDRSAFAGAVAQEGGLPFLALALMDGDQVAALLRETADRLGGLPWGVGVAAAAPAGFTPPHVREAQLAAVRAAGPPYALLAGGTPAEARALEEAGIGAYLHVPSPGPLGRFLDEGARRFVLAGGEGGGHAGPWPAFPLWDAAVGRLLASGDAAELSVLFAGGVHDERSAAMVAALAGPLAERGADVRVLMGTGYLFTTEAVATGAIVPGYQDVAVACDGTALLESSEGRVTRCARTPYVETFAETRRELEQVGTAPDEVGRRMEKLNFGRLGVAAKGVRRSHPVAPDEQRAAGLYAMGDAAALRSSTTGIAALHEQVTSGATAFLAARAAELGVAGARRGAAGPDVRRPRPADVAIIGMACVFPGARDADGFWADVVAGADRVGGPSSGESEGQDDPPAEVLAPSGRNGALPEIPFDPGAYGIPPDALGGIAPVQLLALEVAARALRDAGYASRPFDRSRTSVFVGAGGVGDLAAAYGVRPLLPAAAGAAGAEPDEEAADLDAAGSLTHVIAGRIAHALDLAGANCTLDAGDAASLAALDAACKDLAAGTSDMVLCGAADLGAGAGDPVVPGPPPSGRCAPFDASAGGAVPGEGAAFVVLKRLADAERDGDRVYAVVKSVAASSDGRSLGLTVPRADGQRLAIDRAHERAGVPPASIGLVEAHGAGDETADRTELSALASAFADAAPGGVTLGSVKAQIGHTGRAAGLAGLIKTAYALHAGVLPGSPHLTRPVPEWKPDGPLAFGGSARPWAAPPRDRYAGVSAFGRGGANFHAVLSGYDGAPEPVSGLAEWPAELFLIRAADRARARAELRRLRELAEGGPRLRDLARTAASLQGPVQAAFVATGPDDLRRKIALADEFRPAPGIALPGAEPGQVAFLFPGQGGERPNMLADLFVAFPRLQRLLRLAGGRHAPAMFPPAAFTADEAARHLSEATRAAAPALGIAGLAVHRLLTAVGVHPDLAAGHGHGELVALCAAGVFDETDLIELSAARAEAALPAEGADPGAAASVAASPHEVAEAIAGVPDVVIARHDAPRQVVIAGTRAGVDGALAALSAAGLAAEQVAAPCAFPGPRAGTGQARDDLAGRDLRSPAFPVWSNATAAPYDADPAELAATLAGQAAAPVRFVEQIEAMYAAGARTFVEAGPGRLLTGRVGEILGDRPHTAVSCDAPGTHGLVQFLHALAELAAAGVPVDPLPLFAGRDARPVGRGPEPAPGWLVDGRAVRPAAGTGSLPPSGTRDPAAEAAVLEYLRNSRELIAAQREVILRHLGAIPPASVPAPRSAEPTGEDTAPVESGPLADRPTPPNSVPDQRRPDDPRDAGPFLSAPGDVPVASEEAVPQVPDARSGALPDDESSGTAASAHGGAPESGEEIARQAPDARSGALPDGDSSGAAVSAHGGLPGEEVARQIPDARSGGSLEGDSSGGAVPASGGPPVSDEEAGRQVPEARSGGSADDGSSGAAASAHGREPSGEVTRQVPEARSGASLDGDSASPAVSDSGDVPVASEEVARQVSEARGGGFPDGGSSGAAGSAHGGAPREEVARQVPDSRGRGIAEAASSARGTAVANEVAPAPGPRGAEGEEAAGAPSASNVRPASGAAVRRSPEAQAAAAGRRRVRVGDRQVWPRVEEPGRGPSTRRGAARHVLRAVELDPLPRPPETGTVFAGRRFVVVDDGCGIAVELAALLGRHGARVETPRDVDGPCDGLIHLGALRPAATGVLPQAYEGVRRALAGGLRWLVLASGAGGRFGHGFAGGGVGDPRPGAGLRGFARTVALEYPEVLVRALDVDTKDTPRAIALRILAELLDTDAPVVVGHEGRVRRGFRMVPQHLDGEPAVPLGPNGVVLLSGEPRGITARVALELARTSGCHIEFVARSPEPTGDPAFPDAVTEAELRRALVADGRTDDIEAAIRRITAEREVRRNLLALRARAASVRYHGGDVRRPQTARDVVADVTRRHGRLDGVVHAAAPAENRLIQDKTQRAFERAYRTTVEGACALAQAVDPALGFFAVLGGAAGARGARGQADRAAAGDACAALAHVWRARLRGRVLVADWEPHPDGDEPGEADAAALLREIAHGDEHQVVFTGPAR